MAHGNKQTDFTVSINNGSATEAEKELAQRVQAAMGQVFNELDQQKLADARQSFPSLRHEFIKTSIVKLDQRLEKLRMDGSPEDQAAADKIDNARHRHARKARFYEVVSAIVPGQGLLRRAVESKMEQLYNEVANENAVLLKDNWGERPASKMLPEEIKTQAHAEISAELGMKGLESLIRRSMAPL